MQRADYELAEAYGFKIVPCPPRRPELKSRVERGAKYVKRSFLRPHAALDQQTSAELYPPSPRPFSK